MRRFRCAYQPDPMVDLVAAFLALLEAIDQVPEAQLEEAGEVMELLGALWGQGR